MNCRLDRLLTIHIVQPLLCRNPRVLGIPILMYHNVADYDETGIHPYYRIATSPSMFRKQMSCLRENGYCTVALDEVKDVIECPRASVKYIAITFDDGYRDFLVHAFPVLQDYGFTATVFLPTSFIGDARMRFKDKPCMTWNEVRELTRSGVSFGSHTHSHPQLHSLTANQIKDEITISKQLIEDRTGSAVVSFAHPFAFPEHDTNYKSTLLQCLRTAGYKCGVCTTIGLATYAANPFFFRRLPVNSCDDLALFTAKLAGAYDWLSYPQYWGKKAKARFARTPEGWNE